MRAGMVPDGIGGASSFSSRIFLAGENSAVLGILFQSIIRMNLTLLQNLILTPVLIIAIIALMYRFVRRNFPSLRLGVLFFVFAVSLLGYYFLTQLTASNALKNIFVCVYPFCPWAQKLLIFVIIAAGAFIILKVSDELIFSTYLLKRADIHVPSLFRSILIFALLAVIVLIVLRIEFGLKLTGILTSSAILSVILGLALQDTLSNIIAGIVLHIEKPFSIGDWVKIGASEGEVVEISWRATRLKTLDGNYIVLPNTNTSKEIVLNYYKPSRAHAITFNIGLAYASAPNTAKEIILKTIQDCQHVLDNPSPSVYTTAFGDHAVQYEIRVWINDHAIHKKITDDIMTKLWYSLRRNNIQIPFPIRTVYMHKEDEGENIHSLSEREKAIKDIELFRDIPEKDVQQLAEVSKIKCFTKGEKIITQGEEGYSLYIITHGHVNIVSFDARGHVIPIRELKQGDYFGEMSLLTGEKRSATVMAGSEAALIEIESRDILPIIKKHPQLMEVLSQKLAERKLATKDIIDKAILTEKLLEKEALSKNIFHKIKEFFAGR